MIPFTDIALIVGAAATIGIAMRDEGRRAQFVRWSTELNLNLRPLGEPRLVRAAVRAARADGRPTLNSFLLANDIMCEVCPDDLAELQPLETIIARDVTEAVAYETDGRAVLTGPVRFRMRANPALATGQVRMRARVHAQSTLDAWPAGHSAAASVPPMREHAGLRTRADWDVRSGGRRTVADSPGVATRRLIHIIIKVSGKPTRIVTLEEGQRRIGRGSDNDVRIDDPSISEAHAELAITRTQTFIRDLGSTNGLSVTNGVNHRSGFFLNDGAAVRLSRSVSLIFSDEEASGPVSQ
jgi:hypothetical protein